MSGARAGAARSASQDAVRRGLPSTHIATIRNQPATRRRRPQFELSFAVYALIAPSLPSLVGYAAMVPGRPFRLRYGGRGRGGRR